jgi:hypothetical protein
MSPFKIDFRIDDYKDILPAFPSDDSLIMNVQYDDIDDQYWRRERFPDIITPEFIFQEAQRLKDGVWILIKGVPIWIPPNYYQFLRYGIAGGGDPQFRLKRLKNVYTKIKVRKNPRFIGTYNIKNRQDGDTTFAMSDCLWEIHAGELANGMIGMQSKTMDDAKNPCWFNLVTNWINYPQFFLNAFYPHFISGDNIAESLAFQKKPDPNNPNDRGSNSVIKYFPAVFNAMDGKGNVRKCIMDEINKWIECSFQKTFDNYKKFIMPGNQRRGLFDIFSSPADKNGVHNDEAYKFWQDSDPKDIQVATGSTKTRILRMYSNPLDGIEGFYDKFGDADPQEIYEHIMKERATKRPDQLMEEVRGYPLPKLGTNEPDEEEIFGATDTPSRWSNAKGIKARILELKKTKPPVVYGNLEWPYQTPDSGIPVFRAADLDRFDNTSARFCFANTELKRVPLADLRTPPDRSLIEGCIGSDPFNSVYHTKNKRTQSMGAAVDWRFRDLSGDGWAQTPTGIYLARPQHKGTYHEDMIKFCLFTRSLIQYENSDGGELHDHFLTRGYDRWMLDSRDKSLVETPKGIVPRKGDAPSGGGATAFLNEIIRLIDDVTNLPLTQEEKYLLAWVMFLELLEDVDVFNRDNTIFNHLTMAWGQSLLGRNKILFEKQRERDDVNDEILEALMS